MKEFCRINWSKQGPTPYYIDTNWKDLGQSWGSWHEYQTDRHTDISSHTGFSPSCLSSTNLASWFSVKAEIILNRAFFTLSLSIPPLHLYLTTQNLSRSLSPFFWPFIPSLFPETILTLNELIILCFGCPWYCLSLLSSTVSWIK